MKKYLKELEGKHDVILRVLDGRTWHVTLKDGKFYKGWKDFASDNRLNVGDVCIFELTESQGLCFKVSIIPISQGNLSWSFFQIILYYLCKNDCSFLPLNQFKQMVTLREFEI